MRKLQRQLVRAILISSVAGCGFSPGMPGETLTGAGGSSGNTTTGAGGATGNGGGGDVGLGTGGMSCGQSSTPVMPEPPDILIVQDKSGSMTEQANGCCCGTSGSTMCSG